MLVFPGLWALFTIIAAALQTARNAMQRSLVETVGTVGATHVRFLFGLPFALLFFVGMEAYTHAPPLPLNSTFFSWIIVGATAQMFGTGLMLAAMRERSFVVATAYTKAEPVIVAIFAVTILGDHLSLVAWAAIGVATVGILLMSFKPGAHGGLRPALLGLGSAALFGLAATGFRGAVQSLGAADFFQAATTTLVWGLGFQAIALSLFLAVTDLRALLAIVKAWRPSLLAGFLGAAASQFWFLAFALETTAKVRTLALVEVLFASLVTGAIIKQATSPREGIGIVLIVLGVATLLAWG